MAFTPDPNEKSSGHDCQTIIKFEPTNMGGKDGNRGYLIQATIALLESLSDLDWTTLIIEPDHESEKIDILWKNATQSKAVQVKSSINQIDLIHAKKWADELEGGSTAEDLSLILVGPCSGGVAKMNSHGRVSVPCPKNLDFDGLFGLGAHLLDRFLAKSGLSSSSPQHRELMVRGLIAELSAFSSYAKMMEREDFIALLISWVKATPKPDILAWELVDFSHQRGIESAIAGKRLGPADVEACPEFEICKIIVEELKRSHSYSLAGQAGCGKSISAWQVSKKFHDEGFSVWRPLYSAEGENLLKGLPSDYRSLLVVDDAQRFGRDFLNRLSERSCGEIKILYTTTLSAIAADSPAYISPKAGVETLKHSLLIQRERILPLVQRFDEDVGNRYMDVSFEARIESASRQNTPWEFFWVLRGGWRAARIEYESLKQIPKAETLLNLIALEQICSCDAGVTEDKLDAKSNRIGVPRDLANRAFSHLHKGGLISLTEGVIRTKHISYAYRVVGEGLTNRNRNSWKVSIDSLMVTILDEEYSLEGIYWLLDSVWLADALRAESRQNLQEALLPLLQRCKDNWKTTDWAIGCAVLIFKIFQISAKELLEDRELILAWFTRGTGRAARFAQLLANDLINGSDKNNELETKDIAKNLFEEIDCDRLVEHANSLDLRDFHNFASLLDRLSFYRPTWQAKFIAKFDWDQVLRQILRADSEWAVGIDKLIGSLSTMASAHPSHYSFQFLEDALPFIVRATNQDPINAIQSMHSIFWRCLGLAPNFLRGGKNPNEEQIQIAKKIVVQLDPKAFANAMRTFVSRDLENLARSLSIINEVDPEFCGRVADELSEKEFHKSAEPDWRIQTEELQQLIAFFCKGSERQPARDWVAQNKHVIKGSLEPRIAGIAPKIAIEFFKEGRKANLLGNGQRRWPVTALALASIAEVDEGVAIEMVDSELHEVVDRLYELSLDPPQSIIMVFRIIFALSTDLFEKLVAQIDLSDAKALETIKRLNTTQPKERVNYMKLARVATIAGGSISDLGRELSDKIRLTER